MHYLKIVELVKRHAQIIKYIISGGTAAAVDIGFLYLFTDILKWWYLTAAIVAFLIAFSVSFTLQKFWTFSDRSTQNVHAQASLYLAISIGNLILNTLLMYVFVDIFHIWYIFAQVIAGGLVAILSYFVYKKFVFNKA